MWLWWYLLWTQVNYEINEHDTYNRINYTEEELVHGFKDKDKTE